MTSDEIRQEFIDYFRGKQHKLIRSAPLVPLDDPTLLFTNAGMNQFKPVFLGTEIPTTTRVVNSQRCMRVSGKHNDLEEVGFSPYHHTLFEMLGNWSFGDYYKQEAILWAWELLVHRWKLAKDRLWVSVFKDEYGQIPDDDEAARIWKTETDVTPDHVVEFGRKDNFWEMGETGPCGPCTEIHIDRGPEFCDKAHIPGHVCRVNGDCRRIIEIWNLVFIQYNRKGETEFVPLPARHVDTGMGLERVTAVIQNASSNYETDLFQPIMDAVTGWAPETPDTNVPLKVIADHSRAAAFLIADGVLPSNEWRGYVLRRIIRRAVRFGTKLGFSEPFLNKASNIVVDKMGPFYPELLHGRTRIQQVIRLEEERFFKTLRQGLPMVEALIQSQKDTGQTVLPGAELFKLYDTFGFPLDITTEIAAEAGMTIDEPGFQSAMNLQKNRARSAWKGDSEEAGDTGPYMEAVQSIRRVKYNGYTQTISPATIRFLIHDHQSVGEIREGQNAEMIIDPVPFYAESGGQVGDVGYVESEGSVFQVSDTVKGAPDLIVLKGTVTKGSFRIGESVTARVDTDARDATARNHTATHILHTALRRILGDHVKQSGSLVEPCRLRFDFTHFESLTGAEIHQIESLVNETILQNIPVSHEIMDLEQALNNGVIALFGEKYGENVRVISIDDYSSELCGGIHVQRTGDIGFFKILSESSIAAGVRRIEAITGMSAVEHVTILDQSLKALSEKLKTPPQELPARIDQLQAQIKQLSRSINELKSQQARKQLLDVVENPEHIEGIPFIARHVPGLDMNQLRDLADQLRNKLGNGIVVLGTSGNGRVHLVVTVSKELTRRFHSGKIIKKLAEMVGGGGGGRPDLAQAGGTQPEKLDEALETVPAILRDV